MDCPKCGAKAGCFDTRRIKQDHATRRRYHCDKQHRWTTVEIVVSENIRKGPTGREMANALTEARERLRVEALNELKTKVRNFIRTLK
jgi:transcriptional regulator NrdR family protein